MPTAHSKSGTGEARPQMISPASLPAERVVLGGIIEDSTLLPEALASGLVIGDFSLSDHRRIFAAILALAEGQSPIDYVLVAEHLGGSQDDYVLVGSLLDGVVVERNDILHHVALVRKKSKLRQLERIGACLVTSACEMGADPDKIVEQLREKLQSIVPAGLEILHAI
jgi:replicative DNA helicase